MAGQAAGIPSFNVTTNFHLKIQRDDTIPAFGGWFLTDRPPTHEDNVILLNIEGCFGPLVDDAGNEVPMDTQERKELVIETLMHEFGHALEQWMGLPDNEERVEAAIESFRRVK